MITRRLFIQMAVVLAAGVDAGYAITLAKAEPPPAAVLLPDLPTAWVPEQVAVTEWLEWYKAWVTNQFPDVRTLFPQDVVMRTGTWDDGSQRYTEQRLEPTVEIAEQMMIDLGAFESAMFKLESTRVSVGWHQGLGYEAGRRGHIRESRSYAGPCNEGFSWYNGWVQGNLDYRREKGQLEAHEKPKYGLGMSYPEGHPRYAAHQARIARMNGKSA